MTTTDLVTWGLLGVIVLVCGFFGFRMFRNRLDQMHMEEQLAELEFQESVMANYNLNANLGSDDRFTGSTGVQGSPPQEIVQPAHAQESSLSVDGAPPAADVAAGAVIRQLTAAGLLQGVDGYVSLHGNPKGAALLRIRGGKLALLVPHMESESFLRHNARRADLIIMAGTDGKAVVVKPLEQFLAEMLST